MKNLSFALMLITFFHLNPVKGQVLENQVLALTKELKKEGYILTHSVISGSLNDEEEENKYFDLEEGWTYRIYTVCDEDCSDIDICLHDDNENNIECDETSTDKPFVKVTPKWSDSFHLVVTMFDCEIEPCGYRIAIFGKRDQ